MGLLDFFFPASVPDQTESQLDRKAIYELCKAWIKIPAEEDDKISEYRQEAIEYIKEESRGEFQRFLRGE